MKKAIKMGIISAACIFLVLFIVGLIISGFDIKSALEVAKNGLVFVLAILMFMLAGMIMIKGKNPEDKFKLSKSHFAIIILIILLFAAIIDYILYYI